MGFYLRKSISVGPLRFNLSTSGIGVSAGVKGLRFGVGPRGNYVHMGRGGLYYRATIPPSSSAPSTPSTPTWKAPTANCTVAPESWLIAQRRGISKQRGRFLIENITPARAISFAESKRLSARQNHLTSRPTSKP